MHSISFPERASNYSYEIQFFWPSLSPILAIQRSIDAKYARTKNIKWDVMNWIKWVPSQNAQYVEIALLFVRFISSVLLFRSTQRRLILTNWAIAKCKLPKKTKTSKLLRDNSKSYNAANKKNKTRNIYFQRRLNNERKTSAPGIDPLSIRENSFSTL